MKKLQIADPEIMRIAIQQEIARSDESRYDHRLHGLLLLTSGQSCQQIAELFGEDRRTVQRWVNRFEQSGLEGMRDGERAGRPACLDANQWESLGRDLRLDASEFGHTDISGTENCYRRILRCATKLTSAYANVSASFPKWAFD